MMQNNTAEMEDTRLAVPDGGIASFVPDDNEMDDEEDFGSDGIAQFPALAKRMAAYGRNGDDSVAHVQTGELVIPAALLAQDPALKEGLFQRLRDMGIEDPERYVVGSEANSINPETGMPEFFFKKLWKGIKNAVKGVVKVIKKVATVVLPIVGSMVFGPIYGAALGSGIATLINGGSFKDALKSAAFSGITGGLMSGVSGAISGVGFGEGVKAGLNPANISAGFGALKTGFTEGFGQSGIGFQSAKYGIAGGEQISSQLAEQAALAASAGAPQPTISSQSVADAAVADAGFASGTPTGATNTALPGSSTARGAAAGDLVTANQAAQAATGPGTFTSNIKDAFTPGGKTFMESMGDAFFPKAAPVDTAAIGNKAFTDAYTSAMQIPNMTTEAATVLGKNAMTSAVNSATSAAAPSFLRTYGPLALAGTAVAAGTGMFSPTEAEPAGVVQRDAEGNVITGADLIAQNPGDYLAGDIGTRTLDPNTGKYVEKRVSSPGIYGNIYAPMDGTGSYSAPNFVVPTTSPFELPAGYLARSNPGGPFARPYVTAAQGGAIFPRRNGGIMPDEGVPGKDSVRAMLMPGEFVMTTDAVRGAGNGNVQQGIRNMYSMMRNLETRGKAMA